VFEDRPFFISTTFPPHKWRKRGVLDVWVTDVGCAKVRLGGVGGYGGMLL